MLFDRESKLPTVASGFGFTEGPVWNRAGFVVVSDEVTNKIYRSAMRKELISLGDPDDNTYARQERLDRLPQRPVRQHALANGRFFAQLAGGKGDGVPDGMKVDQAENIHVTGPMGIWVWHSAGDTWAPSFLRNNLRIWFGEIQGTRLYVTASILG